PVGLAVAYATEALWEAVLGAGRAAVPVHCQRPATTECPQSAPSLRVAAKRRACGVARLANRPSYSLRRAPCIHRRLASNAYVRASSDRLLAVARTRSAFPGPVREVGLAAALQRRFGTR